MGILYFVTPAYRLENESVDICATESLIAFKTPFEDLTTQSLNFFSLPTDQLVIVVLCIIVNRLTAVCIYNGLLCNSCV